MSPDLMAILALTCMMMCIGKQKNLAGSFIASVLLFGVLKLSIYIGLILWHGIPLVEFGQPTTHVQNMHATAASALILSGLLAYGILRYNNPKLPPLHKIHQLLALKGDTGNDRQPKN